LASSKPSPEPTSKAHLFIIDDDLALLRLLRLIFEDSEFQVETFGEATAALALIGSKQPDLIILDLNMPIMDGREFYRTIRQRGVETPVLILSAYGGRAAQRELGAQGYMEKPFVPDLLVEAVKGLLLQQSK
jgi:two-component system alkaline phosphatase synthesis response regulator PhoP